MACNASAAPTVKPAPANVLTAADAATVQAINPSHYFTSLIDAQSTKAALPRERPTEAPDGFDGTYHPEGLENTPRRYSIVRTNQIMVDSCDWLVCYVRHGASNSRNLLEYAQRCANKGLIQIKNISESEDNNK